MFAESRGARATSDRLLSFLGVIDVLLSGIFGDLS